MVFQWYTDNIYKLNEICSLETFFVTIQKKDMHYEEVKSRMLWKVERNIVTKQ